MRYGIQYFSKPYFAKADIALSGPNVGHNTGPAVLVSGTMGAAIEAAKEGLPAIAFSWSSGSWMPWTEPSNEVHHLYAAWSVRLTHILTLVGDGYYMPAGTFLNVNLPTIDPRTGCSHKSDIKFVLTRVHKAIPLISKKDVEICGNQQRYVTPKFGSMGSLHADQSYALCRLPSESAIRKLQGCYASVSLIAAYNQRDAIAFEQRAIVWRLRDLLVCAPVGRSSHWWDDLLG